MSYCRVAAASLSKFVLEPWDFRWDSVYQNVPPTAPVHCTGFTCRVQTCTKMNADANWLVPARAYPAQDVSHLGRRQIAHRDSPPSFLLPRPNPIQLRQVRESGTSSHFPPRAIDFWLTRPGSVMSIAVCTSRRFGRSPRTTAMKSSNTK